MTKRWGPICWTFLHTFAEHIPDEVYHKYKRKIFNVFMNTLHNLPCPYCRKHALQYHKLFNMPNTKEQFKNHLFNFHNYVNQRLQKSNLNSSILKKYKSYSLKRVFYYFVFIFQGTRNGLQLGILQRSTMIKDWNVLISSF